jgi:membrane associated rhomboid family serine protease
MMLQSKLVKFLYVYDNQLISCFRTILLLWFTWTILFFIFKPGLIISNIANLIALCILNFLINNIIINLIKINRDCCTDTFKINLMKQ